MELKQGLGALNTARQATKKLAMFSKQWSPGDTLRVFYKVFKLEDASWEILAGSCWGYKVNDIKGLGLKTSFIPALCQFDADGNPVGNPDVLWRFSRLAPSFVKGRYAAEIDAITKKQGITDAMRRDLIRDIDAKYDTQNNMEAERPIISRNVPLIVIEAICVPMKDGVPTFETLVPVMQPASDTIARRLATILDKAEFQPEDGDDWIEIEYAFPMVTRKAEAGLKVTPTGVVSQDRIKNKFPDKWNLIKAAMAQMSNDSEMIIKRSTSAVSEGRIITALSKYITLHNTDLENCALDDDNLDQLKNNIGLVHELNLDSVITDPRVKQILNEAITDINVDATDIPAADTSATPTPVTGMEVPTSEVISAVANAPTITDLLNEQAADENATQAFFENIDLNAIAADA